MTNSNLINLDKITAKALIKEPFPHFCIDQILDAEFAEEVSRSFPTYDDAKEMGKEFSAVNEKRKIEITKANLFPPAILKLNEILAGAEFIERLQDLLGIPNLIADPDLTGGGIHETNSGGRLDVHVDFNYIPEKQLYRRANVLFYFNKDWKDEFGGFLDIWDSEVKNCAGNFAPLLNRACGFATSERSWHGVTPVNCPKGVMRRSFAVYYYTKEPPPEWDGKVHTTVFKARPEEWLKGNVAMPIEKAQKEAKLAMRKVRQGVKAILRKL